MSIAEKLGWTMRRVGRPFERIALYVRMGRRSIGRIYRRLLKKYDLSRTGDSFVKEASTCSTETDCEAFIEGKIKPLFANLENEMKAAVEEINIPLKAIRQEQKIALDAAQAKLDETIEDGWLHSQNEKMRRHSTMERGMEDIIFPEKKLQETIRQLSEEMRKKIAELFGVGNVSKRSLPAVISQREVNDFTMKHFSTLTRLLNKFSAIRHSIYYPPMLKYVRLFYSFCIILSVGEAGFSVSVIKAVIDTRFYRDQPKSIDISLGILYAVAISLSLAAAFKVLIETLLFKSVRRVVVFWMLTVFFWLFFTVFYSTYGDGKATILGAANKFRITQMGLLLGFLSCLFAMANAFLFREASYLHHLYNRLHGGGSVRRLEKQKAGYIRFWESEVRFRNQNIAIVDQKIEGRVNILERYIAIIQNLMRITITSFRISCQEALLKTVTRGRELYAQMARFIYKNKSS